LGHTGLDYKQASKVVLMFVYLKYYLSLNLNCDSFTRGSDNSDNSDICVDCVNHFEHVVSSVDQHFKHIFSLFRAKTTELEPFKNFEILANYTEQG
jgi:hypothetical protein